MTLKYKVGDVVTIKENIQAHCHKFGYTSDMGEFAGKTAHIFKIMLRKDGGYNIDIDNNCYSWEDDNFEDDNIIRYNELGD